MKNNDLENKIASAFDDIVPKDTFDKISKKIVSASSEERTVISMTEKKANNKIRYFISVAAACILLVAGVSGGVYYSNNVAVESIIGIDVNPGIEIEVNKNDRVIDVNAVNEDGVKVLDSMDLKDTELKVAVNAIIGSMVSQGYVAPENSSILVTVQNDDENKAIQLKEEIASDIDAALLANNADAAIINQTVSSSTDADQFASDNNISLGKAVFILNLVQKDSSLVAEDLAKMSISEIAVLVNESNIDISDIADYDADDSIWENIADSIEDVNEEVYVNEQNSAGNIISDTDAKMAALAHAGLSSADVTLIKVEYDVEDGKCEYDVEFVYNGVDYEYEINALTGEINCYEKEPVELDGQNVEICYDDDHHEDDHH